MDPMAVLAAIAPELATDPRAPTAILIATEQVNVDHCYRSHVIANLAAHMLASSVRASATGGVGGAVTSYKEGDLSITYAAPKEASGSEAIGLGSTTYGSEVLRLNQLCYGIAAMTGWAP